MLESNTMMILVEISTEIIYKRGNSGNVIQGCAVGVRRIVARGARYIKSIHIDSYSSINILAHQKPT